MVHHFESYKTSCSNHKIYLQGWEPETDPQAVVCLVHGMGEHSGRYGYVAKKLTEAGYVLTAIDLCGHGKSDGPCGHVDSEQDYIDNIDELLDEARARYPGKGLFLYGHSLGGALVLFYTLKKQPELLGVIASSPGLSTPLEEQKTKVMAAKLLGPILPTLSLPSGLDPAQLSRDPKVVQAYKEDPLVHNRATIRFASTMLGLLPWINEHAHQFKLPLLIYQGTADRVVYPSGSQEFASRVPGDCTLKLWEGLFHETHNEPEKEEVLNFFIGWLDSKV